MDSAVKGCGGCGEGSVDFNVNVSGGEGCGGHVVFNVNISGGKGGVGSGSFARLDLKNKTFAIKNTTTGLVLTVQLTDLKVIMSEFTGDQTQLWEYKNNKLYSKANGKVLEMTKDNSVCVAEAQNTFNQLWEFDDDDGTIGNKLNFVLDMNEGSKEPGTAVTCAPKNGGWGQIFITVRVGK